MGDGVFFEESIEVVGGDDLCESIVLLNVFIDLCFVGVGIDFVIAIEFLGEVDHLQQNVELLLIFDFPSILPRLVNRMLGCWPKSKTLERKKDSIKITKDVTKYR